MPKPDLKVHGVDLGKQLVVMSLAVGILVGLSKLGMCSPPWQTPARSEKQHEAITEESRVEREVIKMEAEKDRTKIRLEEKERHEDSEERFDKVADRVEKMYYWQLRDRRNRDE
jgi:hypothetical protein